MLTKIQTCNFFELQNFVNAYKIHLYNMSQISLYFGIKSIISYLFCCLLMISMYPKLSFHLFPDDTYLFQSSRCNRCLECQVNKGLANISNCLKTNKLTMNVKKIKPCPLETNAVLTVLQFLLTRKSQSKKNIT